jgi:hypothetical protein
MDVLNMKSTILLTTALFLASAPSLDAKTISEFSGGFLVQKAERGLMASESALNTSRTFSAQSAIVAGTDR